MDAAETVRVLGKAPLGVAIGDAYLASVVKGECLEEDPEEVEKYWKGNSCAEQEVVEALAALGIGPNLREDIKQIIMKGATANKADLKVHKKDLLMGAWLPVPDEVNPIKLGIFTNYRYTRLKKIIFTVRNFDKMNMFKFSEKSAHMHVPRVLGFRYTTDYQDLGQ